MPKLPDALGTPQDLGAVPPDPSRLIPHYEAGQVGAAMQGFARDLGASANQAQDVQDRLNRAAAEQDFISKKLDLDQQFAGDPDYSTAPQRYRQALLQALNDSSQGILGPVQRADFQQQMSRFTEAGVDTMLRQSMGRARDAGRASVTQAGDVAVKDGLRAPDGANRNQVFGAFNDRVQASLEAGYLSPDEAAALRKRTAQSYARTHGWLLADTDPQQALDTLQPSSTGADGQPAFEKVGDWPDLLDANERMDILRRSQQNLELRQRAAAADALRLQRQQEKADADASRAIASRYVSQLASDPTGVDIGALAREKFPESQSATQQALIGAAETAIARSADTAAAGYGPGFWPAFNRVTAADSDPNKISDPVELLKLAGPDGGGALTMQGVQQLQRVLDQNKTVEGRAQSAMEANLLRAARAQIAGPDDASGTEGDQRFQNFLGAYFPALDAGLKSSKTAAELLTPASSDYLGKLIPAFTLPPAQSAADQLDAAASDRRDKDIETNDNRSVGERAVGALTGSAGGMVEQLDGAFQGVSPVLTRQLGKRLGSLGQSDSGLVIVPDDRGILDKATDFDPAKHVFLGHDVYERVPEAEESPSQRFARWFSTMMVAGPLSASKGPGGIKASEAAGKGTRAAEETASAGRVAAAEEAKASTPGEQAVPDATATREVPGATGGSSAAPASVPRVPIGEGEARYVTVGNKQYVALANGNPDLGMIDSPVANAIGREAAPIRLPRATAEGVGEVHIAIGARAEQISAVGYKDPAEFVREVALNYTQIWKAGGGALLLVKRVPEGDAAGRAHSLIVQLEPAADGSAYEVRTAGVFRGSFPAGGDRKLLWQRERANIPPDDTGSQGPFR